MEKSRIIIEDICLNILSNPNSSNITNFLNFLSSLEENDVMLNQFKTHFLFPLIFILRKSNLQNKKEENFMATVFKCIKKVLKKFKNCSWSIFTDLFTSLFAQMTSLNNPQVVELFDEDIKYDIIDCVNLLCKSLSEQDFVSFCGEEFRPQLGHAIYICLQISEKEKCSKLKVITLQTIQELGLKYHLDSLPSNVLTKLRYTFVHFLPGILISSTKIANSGEIQNHKVTVESIKCWQYFVTLVMADEYICENVCSINTSETILTLLNKLSLESDSNTKENNGKKDNYSHLSEEDTGRLKAVILSRSWLTSTSKHVTHLASVLSELVSHTHWKVKLVLLQCFQELFDKCSKSLPDCLSLSLEVILTLKNDTMLDVFNSAQNSLTYLKNILNKKSFPIDGPNNEIGNESANSDRLNDILVEKIFDLCNKLPNVFKTQDDSKILSSLHQLEGILELCGEQIYDSLHTNLIEKLISVFSVLFTFDVSDHDILLDTISFKGDFELTSAKPRLGFSFRYFNDDEIFKSAVNCCRFIGKFGIYSTSPVSVDLNDKDLFLESSFSDRSEGNSAFCEKEKSEKLLDPKESNDVESDKINSKFKDKKCTDGENSQNFDKNDNFYPNKSPSPPSAFESNEEFCINQVFSDVIIQPDDGNHDFENKESVENKFYPKNVEINTNITKRVETNTNTTTKTIQNAVENTAKGSSPNFLKISSPENLSNELLNENKGRSYNSCSYNYENLSMVADYCLEILTESNLQSPQMILILNYILKGGVDTESPKTNSEAKEKIVEVILDILNCKILSLPSKLENSGPNDFESPNNRKNEKFYQIPALESHLKSRKSSKNKSELSNKENFELVQQNYDFSIEDIRTNVILISHSLRLVGTCSLFLKTEFFRFLCDILCIVLEKSGDSNVLISHFGHLTLNDFAKACDYDSIQSLIQNSVPVFWFPLSQKLKRLPQYPSAPLVLRVVLKYTKFEVENEAEVKNNKNEIKVFVEDLVLDVLDSLDAFHLSSAHSLLTILLSFVEAVQNRGGKSGESVSSEAKNSFNLKTLNTSDSFYGDKEIRNLLQGTGVHTEVERNKIDDRANRHQRNISANAKIENVSNVSQDEMQDNEVISAKNKKRGILRKFIEDIHEKHLEIEKEMNKSIDSDSDDELSMKEKFKNYSRLSKENVKDNCKNDGNCDNQREDGIETEDNDETLDGGFTEKKEKVPKHIEIIVKIIERCSYLLFVEDRKLQLIILQIIECSCKVLNDFENQKLPCYHKIWKPLALCLKSKDLTVILYALKVCVLMIETSETFLKNRFIKEFFPSIIFFLESQENTFLNKTNDSAYQHDPAYKAQKQVLKFLPNLIVALNLTVVQAGTIVETVFPYLNKNRPEELSQLALKCLKSVQKLYPELVWLKIVQSKGRHKIEPKCELLKKIEIKGEKITGLIDEVFKLIE